MQDFFTDRQRVTDTKNPMHVCCEHGAITLEDFYFSR